MLILTNLEYLLPEIIITINVIIIILYSVINSNKNGIYTYKKRIKRFSIINLTIALLILMYMKLNDPVITTTSLTTLSTLDSIWNSILGIKGGEGKIIMGGLLMSNDFILTIKIISTISTIVILSLEERIKNFEYSILISIALLGMMVIISANDLMILYLGIELLSLTLYILATINNKGELSTEAGLKYFIIGAVSSGILLLGCALVYSQSGLTGYIELENININTNNINIGELLIIISLLLKVGSAPFHMWVPDVYEGSPTIITAFFAIVPKITIIGALLILLLGPFLTLLHQYKEFLLISAGLSIIVGTLGALNQFKLKRLFAFSAISHIGFILLALSTLHLQGIFAVIIYFIFYIFMSFLTFTILLYFPFTNNYLTLLVGLSRHNPLLAISFAICLLSIAGVPPLAGFLSKYLIISSALLLNYWFITIIAILASIVSAFYYLQLIKLMWFKDFPLFNLKILSDISSHSFTSLNLSSASIIAASSYFLLTALIYPNPWFILAFNSIFGSLL